MCALTLPLVVVAASSADVREMLRSEQLRTAVAAVDSADRPEQVCFSASASCWQQLVGPLCP